VYNCIEHPLPTGETCSPVTIGTTQLLGTSAEVFRESELIPVFDTNFFLSHLNKYFDSGFDSPRASVCYCDGDKCNAATVTQAGG
jgi:hypothetical protein